MVIENKRPVQYSAPILAFLLALHLSIPLLGAQETIIQRAMESAERELIAGDLERAYTRVSLITRFYRGQEMPLDAQSISGRVLQAYSQELLEQENWTRIREIREELGNAPESVLARGEPAFSRADSYFREQAQQEELLRAEQERLAEIERAQEAERMREQERETLRQRERDAYEEQQRILQEERERLDSTQRAQIDRILEENRLLEEERERSRLRERELYYQRQADIERERSQQEENFRNQLNEVLDSTLRSSDQALQSTTSFGYAVIIGLSIAGVIIIVLVIVFVIITLKQQKIQQEQFSSTIRTLHAMNVAQMDTMRVALPMGPMQGALPPGMGQGMLLEDQSNRNNAHQSDDQGQAVPEAQRLRDLLEKSQNYAQEIDKITNRKNATKMVAELVYKISKLMGNAEQTAFLHYTVGLVYDIGFLSIDPNLFKSKEITESQFETIKSHTTIGINMVFFVDEEYRDIFKEGVSKHHENMDGTGYPYGLKGEAIPYVARLIRVVESYVALVSSRDYRQIKDRDAAIEELHSTPQHYDLEIVKALEELV